MAAISKVYSLTAYNKQASPWRNTNGIPTRFQDPSSNSCAAASQSQDTEGLVCLERRKRQHVDDPSCLCGQCTRESVGWPVQVLDWGRVRRCCKSVGAPKTKTTLTQAPAKVTEHRSYPKIGDARLMRMVVGHCCEMAGGRDHFHTWNNTAARICQLMLFNAIPMCAITNRASNNILESLQHPATSGYTAWLG